MAALEGGTRVGPMLKLQARRVREGAWDTFVQTLNAEIVLSACWVFIFLGFVHLLA